MQPPKLLVLNAHAEGSTNGPMFRRKTPLTLTQKLKEILWPSMGWGRTWQYAQLRLIRIQASTRSIATGFAFGASISFTPLPGTHIIGAAALSVITRGNVLASLGGTLIGTPWTFPFMWWAAYQIGEASFHAFGGHVVDMPDNITLKFLWDELIHHPMDLVVPWSIGGFILMALSWPVFYIFSYRMVRRLRHTHNRHHPHDHKKVSR